MSVYFSGMVSGLDTEQLIESLMAVERRPIVLMQQRRNRIEEEQAAWRDVNTRLSNLESKVKDLLAAGVFDALKATSSDEAVAVATATGQAAVATYTLQVNTLARNHIVAGSSLAQEFTTAAGSLTIAVGGTSTEVTIEAGSTLRDVAEAINKTEGIGVRASVVNVDGTHERLVLEGLTTGATEVIQVTGTLAFDLGLDADTVETVQAAQDASFTLNGLQITRSTNEISDAIEGVTFTLKKDGGAEATITVARDLDAAVSRIKAVVDQYNSFYTFAQQKLAKEAILQGDSALIQLTVRVREAFTERVGTGGLDQLALIGITTTREGSLTLDESVLREKLAEDPAAVERLFTSQESEALGVARRAEALIKQYTQSSGLISSRQSMYTSMIDDINEQIDNLEMRLDMRKASLRAQFIRMEQMLAQLNALGNALAGQLAQISSVGWGGGRSAR